MDKILAIDDDDLMLEILREILQQEGYEVVIASSGIEGLKRYRESNHDIVITDLIMPHKDGVSVIQEIKAQNPHVRIIAISGTPDIDKITKAVKADVDRIVSKPFAIDEILDAVAELLEYHAPTV